VVQVAFQTLEQVATIQSLAQSPLLRAVVVVRLQSQL
jgi:hypothetical protein